MNCSSNGRPVVSMLFVTVAWAALLGDMNLVHAWVPPLNPLRAFSLTNLRATTVGPRITSRPRDIFHRNETSVPLARFDRSASQQRNADRPCVLTIDGIQYNVTAWAQAHPGGVKVLEKFHERDASQAFHAAHHSARAIAMLEQFAIAGPAVQELSNSKNDALLPRWRVKLFTKEDPIGVHKYLGVFVLLHFMFRFYQMFFTDPAAGLGTRLGRGPSWIPVLCLLPHGLLSLSSLMFHTVPRERVVGQPMIWQEYRIHNIGFGLRSVVTAALCSMAIHGKHHPVLRRIAVVGSCLSCVVAMRVADLATKYLRSNQLESTTATAPYWEGCSLATQKRFKSFYAYCQFMATIGCLTVTNPAFPLSILLAIQLASLLMTLVRKGLLSTKGFHYGYTATLMAPYLVVMRSSWHMKSPQMIYLFLMGNVLFQIRRYGVSKYAIWLPVMLARILFGDKFLIYDVW